MTCWDRALLLQGSRDHSQFELSQKLKKAKYPEDEISEALKRLIDRKFQSDDKFFDSRLRQLLNRRWGPQKIKNSMRQARVKWNEIRYQEILQELGLGETLRNPIDELIEKKISSAQIQRLVGELDLGRFEDRKKIEEKLVRFLLSKGYTPSQSFAAVRVAVDQLKL